MKLSTVLAFFIASTSAFTPVKQAAVKQAPLKAGKVATKPVATKKVATKQVTAKTVATKPVVAKKVATKPVAAKPKPVVTKQTVKKPVAVKSTPAKQTVTTQNASAQFSIEGMPGALAPVGFFDPLGFAAKATPVTLKRYREAELAHSRVAMLAIIGFLVGEKVEGSSFLFDASISGPAITHITQVPDGFWAVIIAFIGAYEASRAEAGWVDPADCPVDQPGLLREDYLPGDLKFDPLGLKPEDPEQFAIIQTKELQNGRLAMLAAAGFLAQEAVDGKGIIEHLQSM